MAEETKTAQTTPATAEDAGINADDGKSAENVNETEFVDTSVNSNEAKTDAKDTKALSKEQNSENARRRREAERKAELQTAREKAIIEALDGKNPYTGEEMKDSADVNEYLTMKEIKKNGGDPLADFAKFQKAKEKKAKEDAETRESEQSWYASDLASFTEKYPDVNLNELISDKDFAWVADGKVGKVPLSEIYERFIEMTSEYEQKAKQDAARLLANAKASPGALGGTGGESGFYTRDQVKKMSPQEVHKNYDKIRASMKKWK